ncbi:beta-1,6-N-acetylglucosaminyltransferase [Novispirillum sp. DQ9]|uniref:beta-1,6-N-acetylglucosaminyltransferase n=1 Tax=Novispirillum sp. DQ9 TaxID=3398612 RepID=UPI003C797A60
MQHCLLVLAHKVPETLALVELLQDERFFFVIHFDAKTDLDPAPLRALPNVALVEDRVPVFWGGTSMLRATLRLIDFAKGLGRPFGRYCLVSGDALPLWSADELDARLTTDAGEYIHLQPCADAPQLRGVPFGQAPTVLGKKRGAEQAWRFANYEYLDSMLVNPRSDELQRLGLTPAQVRAVRRSAQAMLKDILATLPPRPPVFPKLFSGSQWWALTAATMDYVHAEASREEVKDFFRMMRIPDEHFTQCILGNGPKPERMRRNFMFTNWRKRFAQKLSVIDMADLSAARRQGYLFARKYDEQTCPDIRAAIRRGTLTSAIAAGAAEPAVEAPAS